MKNNIILFGAGRKALDFLNKRKKNQYLVNDCIVGIIDNDSNKKMTFLEEYLIYTPDQIKNLAWDYIIVTSIYFDSIRAQLVDELGIESNLILSTEKYQDMKHIMFQYEKNIEKNTIASAKFLQKFNPKSTVVYTAITGNYDELKEPMFYNSQMEYVCFTNNKQLKSDIWNIKYIEVENDIQAKRIIRKLKILPHKIFPKYDTSIWIDGSIQITDDLETFMIKYQKFSDLLMFPHSKRECVYDEGAECILLEKDDKKILINQLYKYMQASYPEKNGLMLGGFLIRNHNNEKIIKIMEDWWKEVEGDSARDQISLPYVLYTNKYCYDLCDLDLYNNMWIKHYKHNK